MDQNPEKHNYAPTDYFMSYPMPSIQYQGGILHYSVSIPGFYISTFSKIVQRKRRRVPPPFNSPISKNRTVRRQRDRNRVG